MVVIRCNYFIRPKDFTDTFNELAAQAETGIMLLPPGFDLLSEGPMDRGLFVGLVAKATPDRENPGTTYVETSDGLRLIFRDGKYAGFYTPNQAEVLN